MTPLAALGSLHIAEFVPPCGVGLLYLLLYRERARTLARERRPVRRRRQGSFLAGVLVMTVVQVPPLDGLADGVLVAHMVQHIAIGDLAPLLIVFGLTGPVLAPLLRMRATRPLRRLSHPILALILWTADLYAWHLPLFYQLAIEHDLIHALEHACMLWFGILLWLALIGPLPKPRWFAGWWGLGYVMLVRFAGAVLANALIWAQTVLYPVYRTSDAARGLNPVSDQSLAGGVMMIEQVLLTTLVLGWLFHRFVRQDEDRQSLLDLAARHGIPMTEQRAARAARAGAPATDRLRDRVTSEHGQRPTPLDHARSQATPESSLPHISQPIASRQRTNVMKRRAHTADPGGDDRPSSERCE